MELTFEQMAQAEKFPANMVALTIKTTPRGRQIFAFIGGCFARTGFKVMKTGRFTQTLHGA